MKVAILHPELGIGGAERLIVDAAAALQRAGHRVTIFTASHDPARCFPETVDGTLDVRVHARQLPLQIAGRLRAPAALLRMLALGGAAARVAGGFDAIVCDTVAHVIPQLRRRVGVPIVFYCHFPDLLLTPPRRGWYRWYRLPFDRWERTGLRAADRVLVNSAFTAQVFHETFPTLPSAPLIVRPGIDTARWPDGGTPPSASQTVIALGRIVPEKNLGLAVDAFARLCALLPSSAARLIIAGGYDDRLPESRAALQGLRARIDALGLRTRVEVRCSPGDDERQALLAGARCVVYTPCREHFGYVPLEAMAAGRPVIASDQGGPTETVVDGVCGYLRPATPEMFAHALRQLFTDPEGSDRLGTAGRARVEQHFSLSRFGAELEAALIDLR